MKNHIKTITILSVLLTFIGGCANIDPLSPENNQNINNEHGQIEDIRTNQNGVMLELLKLRQELNVQARDIQNLQQGILNVNKSNTNSGIQILQGDGGILLTFCSILSAMILVYKYRKETKKHKKTAEILAQQIIAAEDSDLKESVFAAALNTNSEAEIYHLICPKN